MKTGFILIVFLNITLVFSQKTDIDHIEKLVQESDHVNAQILLNTINQDELSLYDKARLKSLEAEANVLQNQDHKAFDLLIEAKQIYIKIDSLDLVAETNLKITSLLNSIDNKYIDKQSYLDEYLNYAKSKNNPFYLSQAYMEIGKSFYDVNPPKTIEYFQKALKEIKKTNESLFEGRIYQNIGATYASDYFRQYDLALNYYEKALNIYQKLNAEDYIFFIFTNKGLAYSKMNQYDQALYYYQKADDIDLKLYKNKNKEILYGYISKVYKEIGDYKNALEYIDKQKIYSEILDENAQQKAIKEINTKYRTKEKEKENSTLKEQLKRNRILIYGFILLLVIVILMVILGYQNLSKKRKIIEQEKLISIQKLDKVLKEQELREIDLILESQEKERHLIANELHDELGSMLATLKFNFETLQRKDKLSTELHQDLYHKTNTLLNEAYQKVRNISHLKNLGVVGKQGLLVAVNNMAEKMSVANILTINVIPFGLNQRLDNQNEVFIYRCIQEFCTNIIKHSKATEANIYITQHVPNEINIIIEDNGIGFVRKKSTEYNGIGLKNIENKIEQMGGTLNIDSKPSKGTTIILDIPL